MDLAKLEHGDFEPLVGDTFTVDGPAAQPCDLILETADVAGEWAGGRQPFSLIFRGPPEPLLAQATYPLTHVGLGRLEIFIVPVARDAAGVAYQAIFT